ncbi:outer membrane protein [Pararhodobacter marinus]|uniref:Outer membrane protein beta-barrel domain-containing protein n=1 Tax=Pararhodobacter marinus TaxID=2184063 RepID=A0A2U2CIL3_9RHOB|nr:porin family protein [Pararhodobacter marinus]PWE31737.1 hypothetical protein C4N9_01635 [Pararhodobacter marinus]
MTTIARKTLLALTSATLALAAGPALASGPVAETRAPAVIAAPAPAFSWAGAYGGLSYSGVATQVDIVNAVSDFTDETALGIFLGYNWQRGGFVFGTELAYSDFEARLPGFLNTQDNALDLRIRAGYAFDNVLVYGFAGASRSEFTGVIAYPRLEGYSLGLGVQAHLGNNVFVGLEYARRRVGNDRIAVEAEIDTLSLRLGYQF